MVLVKLRLDRKEKRELKKLLSATQDKKEDPRALGISIRAQEGRVIDIAKELNISVDAVEMWMQRVQGARYR